MKAKKTDRKQNKRFPSVGPITSRGELVHTGRQRTLLRPLIKRYRVLQRYVLELAELRAAIKALGGNPDG